MQFSIWPSHTQPRPELVAVTALVEEDVAVLEHQLFCLVAVGSNGRDYGEIEEAPLYVRNPQIRVLDIVGVSLALSSPS